MEFTLKDLENLSALARISLKDDEKEKMLKDFKSILGYVSEINSVSGEVERHKDELRNVMREDIVTNTKDVSERLMKEAPDTEDGFVKVTQIFK